MRKPYPCSDKRLFRAIAVETVVEKEIRIWRGLFSPFTLLRWKRALEQKRLGHFYGGKIILSLQCFKFVFATLW
jgi:hypothetical protein